ncbi:MAG: GvpL/GvpF family gas vesicle protein [Dehalococcoidia bacterium]
MSKRYIYGVISTGQPLTFGQSHLSPSPEEVYTVMYQGLACMVSGYSGDDFTGLSTEGKVRCLMAHQEVIERVMKGHTILPLKFGTLVEDDDEVRRIMQQGHDRLTEALDRMGGRVEMEVAATWDLKRVLGEIGQEEEIIHLRESIAKRPASEALELQIRAGRLVKESLDGRRNQYRDQMVKFLGKTALDTQPNALVADEMVMNVAFLIPREGEKDFDSRVRQINGVFRDQINFRVIGPLPPYSFSTVEVIRPNPGKIEEARQLLGLGDEVSEKEAKEAYRRLAAKRHPDVHPEDDVAGEQFAQVHEASVLLRDYCRGQSDGGGASTDGERCSLRTEDVSQAFLIEIKRSAPQGVLS